MWRDKGDPCPTESLWRHKGKKQSPAWSALFTAGWTQVVESKGLDRGRNALFQCPWSCYFVSSKFSKYYCKNSPSCPFGNIKVITISKILRWLTHHSFQLSRNREWNSLEIEVWTPPPLYNSDLPRISWTEKSFSIKSFSNVRQRLGENYTFHLLLTKSHS